MHERDLVAAYNEDTVKRSDRAILLEPREGQVQCRLLDRIAVCGSWTTLSMVVSARAATSAQAAWGLADGLTRSGS